MTVGSFIVSRIVPPELDPDYVPEPEPVKVTVRLDPNLHFALRQIGERVGMSPTMTARELLTGAIMEGMHFLDHPEDLIDFLPPGVSPSVLNNDPISVESEENSDEEPGTIVPFAEQQPRQDELLALAINKQKGRR